MDTRIRYLNVQHWTDLKNPALIAHLTEINPDVILFTSHSRLNEDVKIRIPNYNTFTTNKLNERHAGSGVAIRYGIKFDLLNLFIHDTIGVKIETKHGPINIMTSYAPPRQRFLPNHDLEFMIRHQLPTILVGDLNARHQTFGYTSGPNQKGRALHQHIVNNRLKYLGPNFPTFYTRNTETKPDCVLANNKFFLNQHIQAGGIGPSDHITLKIIISADPIVVPCPPIPDIDNTDWTEYKRLLATDNLINIDGGTAENILNEFDKIYSSINSAKNLTTPMKTTNRKNNLQTSAKFKRYSKILNNYYQYLLRQGKNEHLEKVIRNIQLLLIEEGNICKYRWWIKQIERIELSANCNKKFWKRIKCLSGRHRASIPTLKYKENNIDKYARTDNEKEKIFIEIIKNACNISDTEGWPF